jgi:hypothetical protein
MPLTCLLWSETADPPSRWVGGGPSASLTHLSRRSGVDAVSWTVTGFSG